MRCGLAGSVLLGLSRLSRLSRLSGLSPASLAVAAGLVLYAVLLLSARRLMRRSSRALWTWAALLSPATLSFQLLDPHGGFRKELILLAFLAVLLACGQSLLRHRGASLFVLLGVCVTCVLSHEGLICFLPYLVAALVLSGCRLRDSLLLAAPPGLAALAAAVAATLHPGSLDTARSICASLGRTLTLHGGSICHGGAIPYLGVSSAVARSETAAVVGQNHYWRFYAPLVLLCLAPLLAGSRRLLAAGRGRELRVIWLAAGVSGAGSLMLFLYAEDWGRWIYIHTVCLSLLLLRLDAETAPVRLPGRPRARHLPRLAALALYAGCWTLPHCVVIHVAPTPRLGYLGLLDNLRYGVLP